MNATLDQMTAALNRCDENSPYSLDNEDAYQAWRARKLESRRNLDPARVFRLDCDERMPVSMLEPLREQISAFNFVIFESSSSLGKQQFLTLNRQFGLQALDSNLGADNDNVTSLQVVADADSRAQYIPYTSRAMNWHTDGYYNPDGRRICAFALYCVNQAGRGGGNYLFDHEMLYLLIREQAPDLLEALMGDDMMRVPANVEDNRVIRAEESGPVFSVQPMDCRLNMRYTSRPHNIVWKSDHCSERALNLVREILMDGEAMIEVRLQDRQGIVCNNILHGRQAFHDLAEQPARLVFRARYHDAIDLDKGFGLASTGRN
ncbi:MAG: TauD/TfdA family dioxygenase [Gammaproteobacteria bacterium]|nr:TauD/TfdA family dioxygenase [Gammaproteobacteria bacterium]